MLRTMFSRRDRHCRLGNPRDEGVGSRRLLRLPPEVRMVDPSSDPRDATLDRRPSRDILLVEDDDAVCAAMRDTLEEEGYRVHTCVHGLDALARLASGPRPHLILVDLRMPVMDGWTFMSELKARPELAAIPAVAITAAGMRVLHSAPVCAGYLIKPLDRSLLLETVALCLSRATPRLRPAI
jgi:CheY-like chemotaxis protein